MTEDISYPRQEALTRRFRLGQPRAFVVAPDGARVAFIRSAGGRDPVGNLWVAEADSTGGLVERLVVDARDLLRAGADIPAAERARRERMRETTAGITAISADRAVQRAAFALDGVLYCTDLALDAGAPSEIVTPGAAVDPRMAPDGAHVAFVADGSLYVAPADASADPTLLAAAEGDTVTWGLADFVAAEELDRVRGLWWLSTSDAVLAERVDEADVEVRWISDPAQPEREPRAHRYPAAGTANPQARLFRLTMDGAEPQEIVWDRAAYPYLATVEPDDDGGAVVSVLSRDQTRQLILSIAADGEVRTWSERVTEPWLTMAGGVPRRASGDRLLEIVADTTADAFRLAVDGAPITPEHLDVTALVHADADGVVLTAHAGPMDHGVYRIGWDGTVAAIADEPGVHAAVGGTGGLVIASTDPRVPGTRFRARLTEGTADISSLAEVPVVTPVVDFRRVGARQLAVALVLPTGHVPGSRRLPVVMAPYGGPHHARVVHAAGAFASDQWLADQGFAVVVVDGAGTPGRGPAFEFEIHRDLAARVLDDQVSALHALAAEVPDLDVSRVGITGWSFGGYLAALAVLDRPDVFHAAVAGAPVTDWALYDTAYTERYLGLPADNPDAYAASSLLTRAAHLERPLLIIHGLADDNVLAANSLQLSSALLAAGRPHSFLPLSGVTHMTPQETVAENMLRLEVDFLATHLQASEA